MGNRIALLENNVISTLSMRKKLTLSLQEMGYEVTVLTTGPKEELDKARALGIKIVDVGSCVSNPLDILSYMKRVRKELKNCQAEVVLTFTIRPAIWGNMVTRLLGIPTITNITGIGPLFDRNDIVYRTARTLYKFVLSKTVKIFFQNQDDMQLFLDNKFATADRVERIPGSGIDYREFMPMPGFKSKSGFHFLMIARLVKDKGVLEYIDACRKLKQQEAKVHCSLLGPYWLQNLKDNTITEQDVKGWEAEGIVEYLGDTSDVRSYMASADCIVLPSYREGTSNVLLEACSMETPCITCNVTGCKEIIENDYNGFLCAPRDADALYDAMKKMMQETPERLEQMGKNGRVKIIKEYDKQIVIDAYVKAIEFALSKKRK